MGIGSGGNYALAAAKALIDSTARRRGDRAQGDGRSPPRSASTPTPTSSSKRSTAANEPRAARPGGGDGQVPISGDGGRRPRPCQALARRSRMCTRLVARSGTCGRRSIARHLHEPAMHCFILGVDRRPIRRISPEPMIRITSLAWGPTARSSSTLIATSRRARCGIDLFIGDGRYDRSRARPAPHRRVAARSLRRGLLPAW